LARSLLAPTLRVLLTFAAVCRSKLLIRFAFFGIKKTLDLRIGVRVPAASQPLELKGFKDIPVLICRPYCLRITSLPTNPECDSLQPLGSIIRLLLGWSAVAAMLRVLWDS
jgi:hypothetical protein